jgi:hypothetical protein
MPAIRTRPDTFAAMGRSYRWPGCPHKGNWNVGNLNRLTTPIRGLGIKKPAHKEPVFVLQG